MVKAYGIQFLGANLTKTGSRKGNEHPSKDDLKQKIITRYRHRDNIGIEIKLNDFEKI